MIYSGLEFGQYFELESNTKCHNIFIALTPITRMAFIFIQMYFIFLNNEVSIRFLYGHENDPSSCQINLNQRRILFFTKFLI